MALLRTYGLNDPFDPSTDPQNPTGSDPGHTGGVQVPAPAGPNGAPLQLTSWFGQAPKSGGGGGGGVGIGDLGGKPEYNFGRVPDFNPPDFHVPTWQEVQQNDPGYQFRLKGGTDALERSAAARGTLRTGGTLKDIVDYGQNYSTQEYGNAFNRAKDAYQLQYQGAKDKFAPKYGEWQTKAQAEMAAALAQYNRQFQLYSFQNRGGGGGGSTPYDPEPNWYSPLTPTGP